MSELNDENKALGIKGNKKELLIEFFLSMREISSVFWFRSELLNQHMGL
ncbi:hypothetical protein Acal01_02106 [Acinetobacter calcoaceticus]